jgi:hypothetical protein
MNDCSTKFERFVFQTAANNSHYRYPSDKANHRRVKCRKMLPTCLIKLLSSSAIRSVATIQGHS